MKKIFLLLLVMSVFLGCKSLVIGGSGKIGDVHGSGGVTIPVPARSK